MAAIVAFLILLGSAGIAFINWRAGLLFCILIGFAQDPLRKLLPPHPTYFVVLVGAAFGFVFLAALLRRRVALSLYNLHVGNRRMKQAWMFFILLVTLQSVNALIQSANLVLPVVGLVMYLGPIAVLLVMYSYADSLARIQKLFRFYSFFGVIFGISVYFSYWFGENWPVLWEIGTFFGRELIIYDVGTVLSSYSGLFRVGEIAAWHAATTVCFLVILASVRGSLLYRIGIGIICALLIGAIILTGRRKMLMALVIFASVYWFLLVLLGRGAIKLALAVLLIGISIAVLGNLFVNDSGQQNYLERGVTVFNTESLSERMTSVLNLLASAYWRGGFLGLGAGVSVGFAGSSNLGGGAAEAGIGKIVVEFGVIGAVILAWFVFRIANYLWAIIKYTQRNNSQLGIVAFGLIAFLVSNAATFLVASQLYRDFFILLILAWAIGILFAIPKIVYLQSQASSMATTQKHTAPLREQTCLNAA